MPLPRIVLGCAAGALAAAILVPMQGAALNSCGVPYESDTYLISTATHLRQLGDPPSTPCNTSYDVRLLADIDLTGGGELTPFGTSSSPFSGTFDGQGHSITGLQITSPPENGFGLIGTAASATIRDVQVTGTVLGAARYSGGLLVGDALNTTISTVRVSGTVTALSEAGGLAGTLSGGSITDATASAVVTVTNTIAGGLVGEAGTGIDASTTITNARTEGSVTADTGFAGGIVGLLGGVSIVRSSSSAAVRGVRAGGIVAQATSSGVAGTVIRDAYSTGAVSASPTSDLSIGGIVGHMCSAAPIGLVRTYFAGTLTLAGTATGGGIAGSTGGCITAVSTPGTDEGNVWDSGTAGAAGAGGTVGAGKTTAQMKELATYADLGWSIVNGWEPAGSATWGICPQVNDGYPFLQGQTPSTACKAPTAAPTSAAAAALTATLLPSRRRVVSGQRVRIGIRTANTGGTAAEAVTSCMRLPAQMVITSAGGAVRSGRTACFRLGAVAAGATVTKVITVRAVSLRRASVTVTGTARATGVSRVNAPSVTVTINPRAVRARVTG